MLSLPLIAIAVITNGRAPNLSEIYNHWLLEGFVPGDTLYFCGPHDRLTALGLDDIGIIDYENTSYQGKSFHINEKKRIACEAIEAKYIFIIHDRFIPQNGFNKKLMGALSNESIDFGAVDVDNLDGSSALRELRLKKCVTSETLFEALAKQGRLTCSADDPQASNSIAINGGAFFLKKELSDHFKRPLRWGEMEDDVLSHDLREKKGIWLNNCKLYTLGRRNAPLYIDDKYLIYKYNIYKLACNIIALILNNPSCGMRLSDSGILMLLSQRFTLVDPLHKQFQSELLPSSLEKIMTRARVISEGETFVGIKKSFLGWKISGVKFFEKS